MLFHETQDGFHGFNMESWVSWQKKCECKITFSVCIFRSSNRSHRLRDENPLRSQKKISSIGWLDQKLGLSKVRSSKIFGDRKFFEKFENIEKSKIDKSLKILWFFDFLKNFRIFDFRKIFDFFRSPKIFDDRTFKRPNFWSNQPIELFFFVIEADFHHGDDGTG